MICEQKENKQIKNTEIKTSNLENKTLFLATIWEIACILYNLFKIDLSEYPEGNVITKKSVQLRRLSGGYLHEYIYYYDNVDVFGVGQFHLPVKNKGERKSPNDKRWKLHDMVLYRRRITNRISSNLELLENAIKQYNSLKKCYEAPKDIESVMNDVERAMQNKANIELEQAEISSYVWM